MKKVTGFVDDFRRANILEKMPKTYFFEEDDRPDKMAKYIRKRNEPIADLMIVPDVKKPVGTDAEAYNQNNLVANAVTFAQESRLKQYKDNVRRGHRQINRVEQFSNDMLTKTATPEPEYSFGNFGRRKYKPPPGIEKLQKADEQKDKEKPVIRKALEEKQAQYDFFLLNKEFQQRMRQNTKPQGVKQQDQYESVDYPTGIRDINTFSEHKEREKIFTYELENMTLQEEIKPIYQLKIQTDSIVNGKGKTKPFQISYLRDLGSINRSPPNHTHNLFSHQLSILPQDMKFHDIVNIASGRLDRHSILGCVRKQGASKQEFLNAQKVYDRLKKQEKIMIDVDVQAGQQMIQDEFMEQNEEEVVELSETARLVSEITSLKYEIGRMAKTVTNEDEFNKEVEKRLRFLLDSIFSKIVEGTTVSNPTLEYLKKNVESIQGITESGFDRKRLLWLYSDCVALFKTSARGENITNLISKSSNLKGTLVTQFKEKARSATPKARTAANKPQAEIVYKMQANRRFYN